MKRLENVKADFERLADTIKCEYDLDFIHSAAGETMEQRGYMDIKINIPVNAVMFAAWLNLQETACFCHEIKSFDIAAEFPNKELLKQAALYLGKSADGGLSIEFGELKEGNSWLLKACEPVKDSKLPF